MVALFLSPYSQPVTKMIRPIFETPGGRQYIGEPVPAVTLLSLQAGKFDCTKSVYVGFEVAQ